MPSTDFLKTKLERWLGGAHRPPPHCRWPSRRERILKGAPATQVERLRRRIEKRRFSSRESTQSPRTSKTLSPSRHEAGRTTYPEARIERERWSGALRVCLQVAFDSVALP